MEFYQLIDSYINEIGCSAKDLAEASGLSTSVISRYRTGERTPSPDSDIILKLAKGISALSNSVRDEKLVYNQLLASLKSKTNFANQAFYKANKLINELNIKQADIAKSLNYNASFISRVFSAQRYPSNVDIFLDEIAEYLSKDLDNEQIHILSELVFAPEEELDNDKTRKEYILKWFHQDNTSMINFLNSLDNFDYKDYLNTDYIHDNKLSPDSHQIPFSKHYVGIENMKKGEIDFMRATILSKTTDDIYMYNDMSMMDMIDENFLMEYMKGLSFLVKKGHKIHTIHNLDRPFQELLVGLETWLPLYMTGQIIPYYFEDFHDHVFCHATYSSSSVGLLGTSIHGFRNTGLYYLTQIQHEVDNLRRRAQEMIQLAKPLMKIYKQEHRNEFYKDFKEHLDESDSFSSILYAPPLTTLSDKLLNKMIDQYLSDKESKGISDGITREAILQQVNYTHMIEDDLFKYMLDRKHVYTKFHVFTEKEFAHSPTFIPLSLGFGEVNLPYTYETYMEHVDLTRKVAQKSPSLEMEELSTSGFKNIQIRIGNGEKPWVLISKGMSPAIHFLIENPILADAIINMKDPFGSFDTDNE